MVKTNTQHIKIDIFTNHTIMGAMEVSAECCSITESEK